MDTKTKTRVPDFGVHDEPLFEPPWFGYKVRYNVPWDDDDPDHVYEYDLSQYPKGYVAFMLYEQGYTIEQLVKELEQDKDSPWMIAKEFDNGL